MVAKCCITFNTETSKIQELKQEKLKTTNNVKQALYHFLWIKLAEVAAEVWAHLTRSPVWMRWNIYRKHTVPLFGCIISPEGNACRLLCASQGQCTASSEYASVLQQNHWLSLFPTHPQARMRARPLPTPLGCQQCLLLAPEFCLTAQAEPRALCQPPSLLRLISEP